MGVGTRDCAGGIIEHKLRHREYPRITSTYSIIGKGIHRSQVVENLRFILCMAYTSPNLNSRNGIPVGIRCHHCRPDFSQPRKLKYFANTGPSVYFGAQLASCVQRIPGIACHSSKSIFLRHSQWISRQRRLIRITQGRSKRLTTCDQPKSCSRGLLSMFKVSSWGPAY